MNALDELLKDTFDEDARTVPQDDLLASRVTTTAHRQIRRARLGLGTAAAALVVLAGLVGAQLISSGPSVLSPAVDTQPDLANARTTSYAQFLDELARWAGFVEQPEVEPRRTLSDGVEHSRRVKECLATAGYPDNANSFATAEELADFKLAMYTCHAQYLLDDRLFEPRTESQIRFIREFWIETSIPCLAGLGYDIPEPPSAATLIKTWDSIDRYSVEGEVSDRTGSEAELVAAHELCPVLPALAKILKH